MNLSNRWLRLAGRALIAAVLTAAISFALIVGWWLFLAEALGDSECGQGECGPWGEFTDDTWPLVPGLALGAAVGVTWAVMRRRGR